MAKMKKVQRELAIKLRIEELLVDHRGFSKRKLYAMAKQWVEHHHGSKATRGARTRGEKPNGEIH